MDLRKTSLTLGITLVAMLCVGILGLVGYTSYLRITYPFELSPFEGCFVDSALQVASGGPIYAAPTDRFVALCYTPIVYYIDAAMIWAGVEHGFIAGRLVSVLSVCGATFIAMWLVFRASSRKWLCLLVPPLVAAQYFHANAHFDQVRPDNLLVLFVLASVAATAIRSNLAAALTCSAFTLLAIFTKQSVVMFYVAFFPTMLVLRRRSAIYCLLLVLSIGLTGLWFANAATDGWFVEYTIKSPAFHGLVYRGLLHAITQELLGVFAILTTAIILAASFVVCSPTVTISEIGTREHGFLVLLGAACAAIFYSAMARWNQGSVVYIYVLYAVVGAAFVPVLIDWTLSRMTTDRMASPTKGVMTLVIGLLVLSGYEYPGKYIPGPVDAKQWVGLRETMAIYGPSERLWFPCHGAAVGDTLDDPRRPSLAALSDYVGGYFGRRTGRDFPLALKERIESRYFAAILLSARASEIQAQIKPFYQPDPTQAKVRLPQFSGFPRSNEVIWIPRRSDSFSSSHND